MTCGCAEHGGTRDLQPMFEVLGHGGLREVGEQALGATSAMADAIRYLNKADRAAALDLGDDVVGLHKGSAERWNRQAQRQFRSVIEAIDLRRDQDDWKTLVDRVRQEFEPRNVTQQVQDLVSEARNILLETDRLSGLDVEELLPMISRGADALIEGGLDGIVGELRDVMELGLAAAEHPEMGRQPASPISAARGACIAAAWVAAAVALAICSVVTFCWCCAWPFIAAALAVALTICAFID